MAERTDVVPVEEGTKPAAAGNEAPSAEKASDGAAPAEMAQQAADGAAPKEKAKQPSAAPAPSNKGYVQPGRLPRKEKLGFVDAFFLAVENPVLRRELLTDLRSNKAFVLHFIFLFVLTVVVYLAWPLDVIATRSERARQLFSIFGQGQLVLLSVMAPAFSASALALEKEKRTIDLLLTSPIRPHTILLGKYFNSVLYLFLLVLSTAPMVSVCVWLPGMDAFEAAGLYVLLISVAACFGMIGLTCSTFFHRTQASLSITYLVVLPLAMVLLVFANVFDQFFVLSVAIWPSGLLLAATLVMYQACLKRLREPFDPVFKAAEEEDISTQTGLVLVRDRFPDNLLAPARDDEPLPDGGNPVFQKELRCEIFGRGTLFLRLIIQISMFMSVVFLTFLYLKKEYIFVDYLVVFSMLVAPAFASNAFTQERERGTMDLLLTTLITPAQVITAKLLSCCRLSLFLTGLVGITLLFYLLVGGPASEGTDQGGILWRVVFLSIYLLILGVTILFETALGMFCSLICRSTLQSMILTYSTVLVVFGVPIAAQALLLTFAAGMDRESIAWACFVSPFQAVYSVTPKPMGAAQGFQAPAAVWPAYVAFALAVSGVLLGYIYASFKRWCAEGHKPG